MYHDTYVHEMKTALSGKPATGAVTGNGKSAHQGLFVFGMEFTLLLRSLKC